MKLLGVDFESTWKKGVRDAGSHGPLIYCMHPDTEIYICSLATPDETIVGHPDEIPWEEFLGPEWEWVSHNRTFDMAAYTRVLFESERPIGFPETWHCSADLGAYLGIKRDLKSCVKYLLDIEISKDVRAKTNGKTGEQILEQMGEDIHAYVASDAELTYQIWEEYGEELPEHERWLSMHTTRMAHAGLGVDRDLLEEHRHRLTRETSKLADKLPWTKMLDRKGKHYFTPTSRTGILDYCADREIDPPKTLAKDSPVFDAWVEIQDGDEAEWALALQKYRTVDRSRNLLENLSGRCKVWDRPRIPYGLKYHGAHTGRWSGDGGFNMQNMSRSEKNGIKIRNLFVPSQPYLTFIVCDLSQIEARVLLWEAGDTEQLEMIEGGMDVYEAHARKTMGYKDPRPLSEVDPDMRRYAKVRVLGLGYAAGAKTFKDYAWTQHKLELTLQQAKKVVGDFRKANRPITQYWQMLKNRVVRGARRNDGDWFEELPSGRYLYYRDVVSSRGTKAINQMGAGHRFFHPGLLTENRISAISRDIMGYSIRAVEEELDLRVRLHVHDELVVEVPKNDAEVHQEKIERIMSRRPEWAPDLPIGCESHIMERYDK